MTAEPKKLKIGTLAGCDELFRLPVKLVTQTVGILAKRGTGKSYTDGVIAEEMLERRLHVLIVDPIGNWYGLRSSPNGKGSGYAIPVLGGELGDIPLTPDAGAAGAEMLLDQRASAVLDVSLFRKHEQKTFLVGFAETLYRRSRNAVHLILDEADAWAPQRIIDRDRNAARLLGTIEDLVRRGCASALR